MRAVSNQQRSPEKQAAWKPDPTKHYVKVEVGWNGGSEEAFDQLMSTRLENGDPMYNDLGFIPGVCGSSNLRVLECDKKDHLERLAESHVQSESGAKSGTDLAPNAKMNVTKVGPRTIGQLTDPSEMRETDGKY